MSAAPTVKAALLAMIATAVGDQVLTTYGHPGFSIPDDVVAVGNVRTNSEPGPISPARRREESLELDFTISCYRGGGPEVQQTVTERAFALLGSIHSAIQTDPTIAGSCRVAAITRADMVEETDPDLIAAGRITEIVATVTASARI